MIKSSLLVRLWWLPETVRSWVLWPTEQIHLWTVMTCSVTGWLGEARSSWKNWVLTGSVHLKVTPQPRSASLSAVYNDADNSSATSACLYGALPSDRGLNLGGKMNLSVFSVRCMAKAMLKAPDAQRLGMAEQEIRLQLVKRKQTSETVVTQFMQGH